jgi:hypothetical protein
MQMDDFEAAMAAKVAPLDEGKSAEEEVTEAPEIEEAPEAIEAEVEVAEPGEQPRDPETGQFVPKERPEWLPENFKSEEDFAKAYREAQTLVDRQGNELGELRKAIESLQTPQQQAPGSMREALEENPEQVAYWAASQGNEQVLDAALQAWTQQALDEGDATALRRASSFERQVEIARLKHEFSQEVMPSVQAVRTEANTRALAIAKRELSQRYTDFDQVLEAAGEDATLTEGLNPELLDNLRQNDPKAALELVYATASARQRVAQVVTQTQDREADLERKRQATVATSTSAPAERKKEPIAAFKEAMLEPDPHSVHHGLKRD